MSLSLPSAISTFGASAKAKLANLAAKGEHEEPRQLAEVSARLCRLLRQEVAEQLAIKNPALTTQ